MTVTDREIVEVEKMLLPSGAHFSDEAKSIIRCWESKEILACPGSGKTTILLAKLKLLADRLPLEDGRGICVLSHTNVAINELKDKLKEESDKLLSYPSFIGTIQSFVDRFVAFPYLKKYTDKPISVVDEDTYVKLLWEEIHINHTTLQRNIQFRFEQSKNQYDDIIQYLKKFYIDKQGLKIVGTKKLFAGPESKSFKSFAISKHNLLKTDGIITYNDAYKYAFKALSLYDGDLNKLISSRFKYVFVDEYQDCSEIQREILDKLFACPDTVFQKIGDVDQAIYGNPFQDEKDWKIKSGTLTIENSNRYGQEIADLLTKLRPSSAKIVASRGNIGIKPTLIVFDDATINKVIPTFIDEININGLAHSKGVYKAVGMIKNSTGLKIADYWNHYVSDKISITTDAYPAFVNLICLELSHGRLFAAERYLRKLLCRICHYLGIKTQDGKEYGMSTIKRRIDEKHADEYRELMLGLSRLESFDYDHVDERIRRSISIMLSNSPFDKLPKSFLEGAKVNEPDSGGENIYRHMDSGISVSFDTVHGVKGETHDATLYLETETQRASDLFRTLSLLINNQKEKEGIYKRSSRCVYVGFSRPKHLLCIAIRIRTYEKYRNIFEGCKIVNISDSSDANA